MRAFSCTLGLRLLRPPAGSERKRVWLIRHGESEWNRNMKEARSKMNPLGVLGLIGHDHPLSTEGCRQASRLWEDIALLPRTLVPPGAGPPGAGAPPSKASLRTWRRFLAAPWVLCSPLTRAVQTCLLALEGHPTLADRGILLVSDAREVKGRGGMDCVGVAVGSAVRERALRCLQDAGACTDAQLGAAGAVDIDAGDASSPWWTPQEHKESEAEVRQRVQDLLARIRFLDGRSAIVAGHSLLFKSLASWCQSPALRESRAEMAADMKRFKMQNCGVMELELDFRRPSSECIVGARMCFGTDFARHERREQPGEAAGGGSPAPEAGRGDPARPGARSTAGPAAPGAEHGRGAAGSIGRWARRGMSSVRAALKGASGGSRPKEPKTEPRAGPRPGPALPPRPSVGSAAENQEASPLA
jgi:broad specificity phosphatase PhoE